MRQDRRILLVFLIFALAGGVWAAIYAQKKGFSKTWRSLIEAEFAKRGYFTKIGKVTLGPMQGLVAEDVFFFQDPDRLEEIAFVDNMILDLDLTEVLNRDLSINTLDFQDASLSLPLSPGKRSSEMLRVDHFSGRLVVTESQIEIVKAKATLQGIEITVKGSLYRPAREAGGKGEPDADADEADRERKLKELGMRIGLFQSVLQEIDRIEFAPSKGPRLEIEFSGDLADLSGLRASARLFAESFDRESYHVEKLTASLEFDGEKGRATLKELHLRDSEGDLRLRADWQIDGKEVAFDLDSNADLQELAYSIFPNPKLREVNFFDPPRLKMEGTIRLDEIAEARLPWLPMEAIGEFSSDRIGSRGAVFDGLEFNFSISGDRYYVRNIRLDHQTGSLLANLMFDPALGAEAFRYQSEIKLDPKIFAPFFKSEETSRFLSKWTFNRNSNIYLAALGSGPDLNPEHWRSRGLVDLRRLRLNNVRFNRLEANFEFGDRTQTYSDVRLARAEGLLVTPEARYDSAAKMWTVKDLRWSFDLVEGLRAFSPDLAERVKPYRFSNRPEIVLNGAIDNRSDEEIGGDRRRHDFRLDFESAQRAEYDFLGQILPFDNPAGSLEVNGGAIHLSKFKAGLFGGSVNVDFRSGDLPDEEAYTAIVSVERLPAGNLSELFSDSDSAGNEGKLTGRMEFSGVFGNARSTNGSGEATIQGGDVFAIPPFAPLSKETAGVFPDGDAGARVVREATATLKLKNGVLGSDDFEAVTPAFRLKGSGQVDCVEKTVRFDATIDTGAPPTPAETGNLLEFTADGPLDRLRWIRKSPEP